MKLRWSKMQVKKKGIKRENQNMENISFSLYQPCSEDHPPPLPPTPSSTNLSSGEEGEGPKNEVDSLLSIVRYQRRVRNIKVSSYIF